MLKVKQKVVVKGGFGSEKPVRVRIDTISTKNDREIIEYTDWDGQDRWAYVSQIIDFNPDDDKETMDKYALGEIKAVEPEPVKAYPEYTGIISQLTESLDCDADEIVDIVNLLNMTEYWVENKMLDVCEDNDVMRKVLWANLQEFIQKYKPQNLSVEELYVADKSEEDK